MFFWWNAKWAMPWHCWKVPGAHLLHTKMQNLSEEWLSSEALIFERTIQIGAVIWDKHKFVNWWWMERLSWGKGRKRVWEDRRHQDSNELGRRDASQEKSWNRKTGEQLKVCRLSGKHFLGGKQKCFCCVYCGSLFLQENNSHGRDVRQ